MSTTTKRLAPGEYTVTDGVRTVSISRFDHLDPAYGQWVVRAEWSRDIYSDPLILLATAKSVAGLFLEDAADDDEYHCCDQDEDLDYGNGYAGHVTCAGCGAEMEYLGDGTTESGNSREYWAARRP